MATTRVSPRYTLKIPAKYRSVIRAGRKVEIASDEQGRLIITPLESPVVALMATFGLWSGREDLPADSVRAVDEWRQAMQPTQNDVDS